MIIGVTSQNFLTITGHAGKTRRFLIFKTDKSGGYREIKRLDLPKEMSMHEFRGDNHPIDEVDLLITESCGQGFIKRMATRGIKVLSTSETDPETAIESILAGRELPPPTAHDHSHQSVADPLLAKR